MRDPGADSMGIVRVLAGSRWRALAAAHAARADALTAGHRARRARGEAHPVEDFLYTYYPTRPRRLRRWHPGAGVLLTDAEGRAGWRHYTRDPAGVRVDHEALAVERAATLAFVGDLLRATAARPAHLGCFGLHEWAMVYRSAATGHPHPAPRAAAPRRGGDRRGRGVAPHPLLALRRPPLLHSGRRAPQHPGADAGSPGRARAAGVPACGDGPLQVGGQARPARARRPAAGRVRPRPR